MQDRIRHQWHHSHDRWRLLELPNAVIALLRRKVGLSLVGVFPDMRRERGVLLRRREVVSAVVGPFGGVEIETVVGLKSARTALAIAFGADTGVCGTLSGRGASPGAFATATAGKPPAGTSRTRPAESVDFGTGTDESGVRGTLSGRGASPGAFATATAGTPSAGSSCTRRTPSAESVDRPGTAVSRKRMQFLSKNALRWFRV